MAVPLERLFQLSARDAVSGQWGIITQRLTALANNPVVQSPVFSPTADQCAYVTTVQVSAIPGGVIAPTALNVFLLDAAGNTIGDLFRDTVAGGAGVFEAATVTGLDIPLVGLRHSIQALANFSGANPGNECVLSVFGYASPKGNVALF